MLYIYRLCQHGAGGARRLQSVPDSADARPRTSPHSSVYFLNRPLFGLTSVGTEYLRKRGRKSVENKGKGKKLCVIETAFRCSWLRQRCRVLGAIKFGHPGSWAGQTGERKTGSDACKYQAGDLRGAFPMFMYFRWLSLILESRRRKIDTSQSSQTCLVRKLCNACCYTTRTSRVLFLKVWKLVGKNECQRSI